MFKKVNFFHPIALHPISLQEIENRNTLITNHLHQHNLFPSFFNPNRLFRTCKQSQIKRVTHIPSFPLPFFLPCLAKINLLHGRSKSAAQQRRFCCTANGDERPAFFRIQPITRNAGPAPFKAQPIDRQIDTSFIENPVKNPFFGIATVCQPNNARNDAIP